MATAIDILSDSLISSTPTFSCISMYSIYIYIYIEHVNSSGKLHKLTGQVLCVDQITGRAATVAQPLLTCTKSTIDESYIDLSR